MEPDIPLVGASYLRYYKKQTGGGDIILYRRTRVQQGDGIGDVLRGVARFLLPLFFRGAKTFANETLRGTDQGMSFGDAAKGALRPTMNAVVDAASKRFQGGNGKRKRATKKRARGSKKGISQSGSGKITKKRKVFKDKTSPKRKQSGAGKRKIKKSNKSRGKGKKSNDTLGEYNF